MENLKDQTCIPCEGGVPPLAKDVVDRLWAELSGWELAKNGGSLAKDLVFKDFDKAMDFVNMVADLAEAQGHHPDIDIRYNKVRLSLSTHAIGGLSVNDFILAAKIDAIKL